LTAAVVLLTRIWGMKRSGTTDDKFDQDMKYVHVCMDVLKRLETQYVSLTIVVTSNELMYLAGGISRADWETTLGSS
jgi:hypothetical protein